MSATENRDTQIVGNSAVDTWIDESTSLWMRCRDGMAFATRPLGRLVTGLSDIGSSFRHIQQYIGWQPAREMIWRICLFEPRTPVMRRFDCTLHLRALHDRSDIRGRLQGSLIAKVSQYANLIERNVHGVGQLQIARPKQLQSLGVWGRPQGIQAH
jgi:hypothetical protein